MSSTLLQLTYMLINAQYQASNIIAFLKEHGITPDVQLPLSSQIIAPLIYFCCRRAHMKELLTYIITYYHKKLKTNLGTVKMQAVEGSPELIDLLYYSRPEYLPSLIKYGATLTPSQVISSCRRLITGGMVDKFLYIVQGNLLTDQQIQQILQPAEQLTEKIIARLNQNQSKDLDSQYLDCYVKALHIVWSQAQHPMPAKLVNKLQELDLPGMDKIIVKYSAKN